MVHNFRPLSAAVVERQNGVGIDNVGVDDGSSDGRRSNSDERRGTSVIKLFTDVIYEFS
jgi:hypothetical protein